MNVLLVAHFFPPNPAVGSIRAQRVAQAFRDAGHRVQVVTARLPDEQGSIRVDDSGLIVHTVRSYDNPRHALSRLQDRLRGRSPRSQSQVKMAPVEHGHVPAWKRHLLSVLWVPDDLQGFIGPALMRALKIARSGVDLVYTTAPPFSDHVAGWVLKGLTNVRWAAEFRDPWSDNPHRPVERTSAEADAVNRWLERRCLRAADHVVTVTQGTQDLLQEKVPPVERSKFILARNGIGHLEPKTRATRRGGPIRIVHAGSLYQDRDPRPFFRALAALTQRHGVTPAEVQVDFIGHCHSYGGQSLRKFTDAIGIGPLVRFTPWIPQDECRQAMIEADLLLLLAQNNPDQVANKLYDYLGTRRPILAFGESHGESARMLAEVGGHYLVTQDGEQEVERVLDMALHESPPVPNPSSETLLEEWSTHRQMAHLLSSLGMAEATAPSRGPRGG